MFLHPSDQELFVLERPSASSRVYLRRLPGGLPLAPGHNCHPHERRQKGSRVGIGLVLGGSLADRDFLFFVNDRALKRAGVLSPVYKKEFKWTTFG